MCLLIGRHTLGVHLMDDVTRYMHVLIRGIHFDGRQYDSFYSPSDDFLPRTV